jgi:hypothetical protein
MGTHGAREFKITKIHFPYNEGNSLTIRGAIHFSKWNPIGGVIY